MSASSDPGDEVVLVGPDVTTGPGDPEQRFWEFLGMGELRLPRCCDCQELISPPSFSCPACLSRRLQWERIDVRGVIWSFTVYYHSFASHLDDRIPYSVALVELAQGPMLLGNVEKGSGEPALESDLGVGLPVRMVIGGRTDQPFYWFTIRGDT